MGKGDVEEQSSLQSLRHFSFLLARARMPFAAQGGIHLLSCGSLRKLRKSYFKEGWGSAVCLGKILVPPPPENMNISSPFSTALSLSPSSLLPTQIKFLKVDCFCLVIFNICCYYLSSFSVLICPPTHSSSCLHMLGLKCKEH